MHAVGVRRATLAAGFFAVLCCLSALPQMTRSQTLRIEGEPKLVPPQADISGAISAPPFLTWSQSLKDDTPNPFGVRSQPRFDIHTAVKSRATVRVPVAAAVLTCCNPLAPNHASESARQGRNQALFDISMTVCNAGSRRTDTVFATIVLPKELMLSGSDAPDRYTKRILPSILNPGQQGAVSCMLWHPSTPCAKTYRVEVWVKTSNADSINCGSDITIPGSLPTLPVSIAGTQTVCRNSTHPYRVAASPERPFAWTATGGSIIGNASSDIVVITWDTAGTQKLIVAARDTVCGTTMYDTLLVTVNRTPTPVISSGASTSPCEGDSVVLDAGIGYASYQWSNGRRTRLITVAEPGRYHVLVTDALGCMGWSDTVTVTVHARPAPVISGPLSVCADRDARYSVPFTPGNTYAWQVAGGVIKAGVDDTAVIVRWGEAGGSGMIHLLESGAFCRDSVSKAVSIAAVAKPVIAALGSTALCEGESVTLDAGAGYALIRWSNGADNRTISVAQAGRYSVYVENAQGCSAASDTAHIRVFPKPPVPVITKSGTLLTSTDGPWSYRWSRDGNEIPGQTTNVLLATASGRYRVVIADSNGCSNGSEPLDVFITGMELEAHLAVQPDLFPDPSTGELTVRIPARAGGIVSITVIDLLGRTVQQQQTVSSSTQYEARLRIAPVIPGTYVLFITSGEFHWARSVRMY